MTSKCWRLVSWRSSIACLCLLMAGVRNLVSEENLWLEQKPQCDCPGWCLISGFWGKLMTWVKNLRVIVLVVASVSTKTWLMDSLQSLGLGWSSIWWVLNVVCMYGPLQFSGSGAGRGFCFHFPFAYWPALPRRFGCSDLNSCFHFLCLYVCSMTYDL